jgi:hypothetical protein
MLGKGLELLGEGDHLLGHVRCGAPTAEGSESGEEAEEPRAAV